MESFSQVSNDNVTEIESRNSEDESNIPEKSTDFDPAEWELVEDDFVFLDLVGLIQDEDLANCERNQLKLIGLFDEHPVLQIGKTYFVGNRKEVPGTNVMFHIEDPVDYSSDEEANFSSSDKIVKPKLKLRCMTRKKLVMEQAFIKKKSSPTADSQT